MAYKSVYARVIAYLNRHKREIPDIAKATRLQVSWMEKVTDGRIRDPGVRKIEKVNEYIRAQRRLNKSVSSVSPPSQVAANQ